MGKKDKKKLSAEDYEEALYELQSELVRLQEWVVAKGEA